MDDVYPVVFLEAFVLKIRDGGSVQRKACDLALAITMDGDRDVLGMWFQDSEGAKFWMQVLTDLKTRGVRDILICCVDGLKGFPEAIEAVYPATTVQTCIVHLIRQRLRYVPRRQYDQVVRDLRPIYTAVDADAAHAALEAFEENWGGQLPVIGQAWRSSWEYITSEGEGIAMTSAAGRGELWRRTTEPRPARSARQIRSSLRRSFAESHLECTCVGSVPGLSSRASRRAREKAGS